MRQRGVRASAASAAPALTERHPARPPLGRRARPVRRGEAGMRRPRRDAPTANVQVPTPTPPRRPTRPVLPGGHIYTGHLHLASCAATWPTAPRPGLLRLDQAYCASTWPTAPRPRLLRLDLAYC